MDDLRRECIVNNLDFSVKEEHLEELFSKFGKVMKVDISLEGKVKKGYVKMSDPSEAKKAQKALDGYNFKGHTLEVGVAEHDGKYDPGQTRTVFYNIKKDKSLHGTTARRKHDSGWTRLTRYLFRRT